MQLLHGIHNHKLKHDDLEELQRYLNITFYQEHSTQYGHRADKANKNLIKAKLCHIEELVDVPNIRGLHYELEDEVIICPDLNDVHEKSTLLLEGNEYIE